MVGSFCFLLLESDLLLSLSLFCGGHPSHLLKVFWRSQSLSSHNGGRGLNVHPASHHLLHGVELRPHLEGSHLSGGHIPADERLHVTSTISGYHTGTTHSFRAGQILHVLHRFESIIDTESHFLES